MASQKNTPGFGPEYEVYVPAYFALVLNSYDEIEDYIIQSNRKNFGNLDDVVIDMKIRKKEFHFAFQLKHKENESKKLLPTNFEAKGDFNLEKYCESFKTLDPQLKKYHFIIYTNKILNADLKRIKDLKTYDMVEDDGCNGKKFFDTSGSGKIYKFRTNQETKNGAKVTREDYDEFLSRFTVYPGQKNYLGLKEEIKKILKYEEQFNSYVYFFRNWCLEEFTNKTLDKRTLNVLLLDIFISPLITRNLLVDNGENLEILERAIKEFDVALLKSENINVVEANIDDLLNNVPNYVKNQLVTYARGYKMDVSQPEKIMMDCLIRLAKDFKIVDKKTKKIEHSIVLKLLCYFFEKPLIVHFDCKTENLIYQVVKLCKIRDYKIKLVVLGKNIEVQQFQDLRIFSYLTQLQVVNNALFGEIVRKCMISIQGRNEISIEKLMEILEDIPQVIGVAELVQMLQKNYLVGDNKEILPSYYMNRIVSTYCLDKELIQQCLEAGDLVIVYYKKTVPQIFFQQNDVKAIDLQTYFNDPHTLVEGTILLTNDQCHYKHFEMVDRKNEGRNVHYVKMVDDNSFLLILNNKNTFKNVQSKMKRITVEENVIFDYFNNPINIISSGPGTGKSTLLKYLKNECPPEWWVLSLDLKAFNDTLKKKFSSEDFLENVTKNDDGFLKSLKSLYLADKKMVIFMDGLDEIETENVKTVVEYTKDFARMGYRVWLFTRPNLQETLENEFHGFMIDIEDLSEEQEKKFVASTLKEKYETKEIDEIIRQIFANAEIAHNRKILGIPLQLYIVTQIFLDNVEEQISKNFFVLTRMYRIFLEGRYQHCLKKSKTEYCHLLITDVNVLDKYKIAALETLFSEEILNKLNMNYLFKQNKKFLESIRKYKDPLGIIAFVDGRNKAVFDHFTFAEYLVCDFLTDPENWELTRILKFHLLEKQYQNLMTFLNIMLAEESPLHLALIYQDVDHFRELLKREGNSAVDKGDRNLFHLLAPVGTGFRGYNYAGTFKFPRLETDLFRQLTRLLFQTVKKEDDQKLQKDKIFEWDPLNYSLFFGSFYVTEEILNKFDCQKKLYYPLRTFYLIDYADVDILVWCIVLGYPNILSAVIVDIELDSNFRYKVTHNFAPVIFSDYRTQIAVIKKVIHLHQKPDDRMKILNKFLYFAVCNENVKLTEYLLEEGADVNYFNRYLDQHVLIIAAENEDQKTTSLLLQKGSDVSCLLPSIIIKEVSILSLSPRTKCLQTIDSVLSQHKNTDVKNEEGKSPLHATVSQSKICLFLEKKGADVNVLINEKGDNILHFCVEEEYANISKLLLKEAPHLVTKPNKIGATPFHVAVYAGLRVFIDEIFDQEINLEEIDMSNEKYPLVSATKDGRLDKEKIFELMEVVSNSRMGNTDRKSKVI